MKLKNIELIVPKLNKNLYLSLFILLMSWGSHKSYAQIADTSICISNATAILQGAPLGGIWVGTDILSSDPANSQAVFSVANAGLGTHLVYYQLGSIKDTVLITIAAPTTIEAVDTIICNSTTNILLEGIPSGGTWLSGDGLIDATGIYNTWLGGGLVTQSAIYEYTDSNQCTLQDTATIQVIAAETVDAGSDVITCLGGNYTLSGSPIGGTWIGSGVTNGIINIDSLGAGVYNYIYTVGEGNCAVSDALQVTVINSMTSYQALPITDTTCRNDLLTLSHTLVSGGIWTGTGVTDSINGTFDLSITALNGISSTTAQYKLNENNGCPVTQNITIDIFNTPEGATGDLDFNANIWSDTLTYCYSNTTVDLDNEAFQSATTMQNIVTYWATGTGTTNLTDPNLGTILLNNLGVGQYIVTISDTITGCTLLDTIYVNVTAPAPLILSASTLAACEGDPVTFIPSSVNPTDSFLYMRVGNIVSGAILNDTLYYGDVPNFTYNDLNNGDLIQLIKFDINDQVCEQVSNTIPMTIRLFPDIDITNISPDNCIGSELVFKASSSIAPAASNAYSFLVDGVNIQVSNDSLFKSSTLDDGNEITIVYEDTYGCSNETITFVHLDTLPITTLINDDTGSHLNHICINDNVNFTASSSIPNSTFSYYLNTDTIPVSLGATYSTDTLNHNDQVIAYVESPLGCIGTATIEMNVDTIPFVDILFIPTIDNPINDTICQFESVVLQAIRTGANIIDSTWISSSSTINTILPSASAIGSTTFEADVTDFNTIIHQVTTEGGCIGQDTDSFFVKSLPLSPVAIPDTGICPSASMELVFDNPSNHPNTVYFWDLDNPAAIAFSGTSYIGDTVITAPFNGTIAIQTATFTAYTRFKGCFSADSMSFGVKIKPIPVIVPISDTSFCSGDQIILPAFEDQVPLPHDINWTVNNSAIYSVSSGTNELPPLNAPLNFLNDTSTTVTVSAAVAGCSSSEMSFDIHLLAAPDTPIIFTPDGTNYCENGSVIIYTNSGSEDYDWFKDNTLIPNVDTNWLAVVTGGNYTVFAKNQFCYSATSNHIPIMSQSGIPISTEFGEAIPAYFEDFSTGSNGWHVQKQAGHTVPSDWEFGIPNGGVITTNSSMDSVWMTGLSSPHSSEQQSWVISPCFDFTATAQPAISISLFLDTRQDVNGLVIQYITGTDVEWTTLGTNTLIGDGWYNSQEIVAEPGGQTIGWSGTSPGWFVARYALDELIGKDAVRFRIAFGASDNPLLQDGVAFDNVWIGERNKPILIEHFTNSDYISANTKTYERIDTDTNLVLIQYHLNDTIYQSNVIDNNTRSLYYNIFNTTANHPMTIIEGNIFQDSTLQADSLNWSIETTIAHSLEPSLFYITPITMTTENDSFDIKSKIILNDILALPIQNDRAQQFITSVNNQELIIRTVIVEDLVIINGGNDTLKHVMRKMLPTHAGEVFSSPSQEINYKWKIDTDIVDASMLDVVIFIQNINTKEVYMVRSGHTMFVPTKEVELEEAQKTMEIFPNPASDYFDVKLNHPIHETATWYLYDLKGQLIKSGVLPNAIRGFRFETGDISSGMYLFSIKTKTGIIPPKKIAILK